MFAATASDTPHPHTAPSSDHRPDLLGFSDLIVNSTISNHTHDIDDRSTWPNPTGPNPAGHKPAGPDRSVFF